MTGRSVDQGQEGERAGYRPGEAKTRDRRVTGRSIDQGQEGERAECRPGTGG